MHWKSRLDMTLYPFGLTLRRCTTRPVKFCGPVTRQRLMTRSFSTEESPQRRPGNNPQQVKEDLNYCVNLVRERDREGFLCGLLMPKQSQRAFFALRAFNVELASVKSSHNLRRKGGREAGGDFGDTSTTVALEMRMQWWKDALGEIYGDPPTASDPALRNLSISCWKSPIVRALDQANQQYGFTRRFLERLVEARALDLHVQQLRTLDESITYAEETVSSLLYLTLESVNIRQDAADEVASYAGIGIGLTTLLRATPFRLVHDEIPIPSDLLNPTFPFKQLFGEENTLGQDEEAEWYAAVEQMATTAGAHLIKAKELQSQMPRSARSILLPMVPAFQFLERLQQKKYNLMNDELHQPLPMKLMFRLGYCWLMGRVL